MRAFFEAIGDLATSAFKILPAVGTFTNNLFMFIIVVAFIYWITQMMKFQKAGER